MNVIFLLLLKIDHDELSQPYNNSHLALADSLRYKINVVGITNLVQS
jgi:hypothetical protein